MLNKRKEHLFLFLIVLAGGALRFIGCTWGLPSFLHPDESAIVVQAISMIQRKSFQPGVFFRPDHFEIQLNSIVFNLGSFLRYGVSADVAFLSYPSFFYAVSRGITAVFGTAMIWLGYLIGKRLDGKIALLSAALIAFFPSFILHSHYATPDIYQACVMMAIAYFAMRYLENDTLLHLGALCLLTAVSTAIKYTGIFACLLIAVVVILQAMKKKPLKTILYRGVLSVFLVLLSLFLISPVLFTNLEAVINAIAREAMPNHLGADGLGFWGNCWFYLKAFLNQVNLAFGICALAGIVFAIMKRDRNVIPVFFGPVYGVIISILSLHWERWAVPIYPFLLILVAYGIRNVLDLIPSSKKHFAFLLATFAGIAFISMGLQSIGVLMNFTLIDSRVLSEEYCLANGITKANSMADSYTPLYKTGGGNYRYLRNRRDGTLEIANPNMQYIIISSNIYARYYNEPTRYKDKVAQYEQLNDEFKLAYALDQEYADYMEKGSISAIRTVAYSIRKIQEMTTQGYSGPAIKIYAVDENQYAKYPIGETIQFSKEQANYEKITIDGLYPPEQDGAWIGQEARFVFYPEAHDGDLLLAFSADSFSPDNALPVMVALNGKGIGQAVFDNGSYTIALPSSRGEPKLSITLQIPLAFEPRLMSPFIQDDRKLGIFLKELKLVDAAERAVAQ